MNRWLVMTLAVVGLASTAVNVWQVREAREMVQDMDQVDGYDSFWEAVTYIECDRDLPSCYVNSMDTTPR